MKGVKKIFYVAALLWGCGLFAQEAKDVVMLKNGAVYKGNISEYIPDESVTIVLLDGRIMKFTADELKEIEEEQNRIYTLPKKGYVHQSAVGFQLGRGNNSNMVSFAYNMLNGYRYQRSVFAAGLGLETLLDELYFPIYGQYSYDVISGKSALFVAGEFGYTINSDQRKDEDPYYYYPNYNFYSGGYLLGTEVGLHSSLSDKLGLTFSVGYRYYRMQGEQQRQVWQSFSYPVEQRAYLHRFGFQLGFQFN